MVFCGALRRSTELCSALWRSLVRCVMPAGRPKGKASYSNADVLELVGVFTECLEHPIERLKATGDGQLLKIGDMDNPNAKDVGEPSVHNLLCQLVQKRPIGLYTQKLLTFVILCLDRRCSNLLSGSVGKKQQHWAAFY